MDVTFLATAFVGGLLLGAAYFLALWATVRRLSGARHPALLLLVTATLRIAALAAGLIFVSDGQWERLLAAVGGFLIVRYAAVRTARPSRARQTPPA